MGGCRICLCLTGPTLEANLEPVRRYRRHLDLVELRADFLREAELAFLPRFPALVDLPVILALRRAADGGEWSGEERQRRRIVRKALEATYAYVDLEEDLEDPRLEQAARARGARIIRSFHDFSGVPENLAQRLGRLSRSAAELPKAAVMPQGCADLVRLLQAFRELEGREKILIGMGEVGLFSRVLAGRLGSWLTYCSPGESGAASGEGGETPPAAPGQIDPEQLVGLYRFRRIDRDTALFGVLGNPIAHSRSPELHNRGYAALGLNAAYLSFLGDEPAAFLRAAEMLGLQGISVTVPFKEKITPYLNGKDETAGRIGACNTLLRRGGGWYGTNTDVEGFLEPLQRRAPELLREGGRATVIGAGGAARAVVYALVSKGARPLILNRSPGRAQALAEQFGCPWALTDERGIELARAHCDLIVQATSVGMEPHAGADQTGAAADPFPGYHFAGTELVYDLVYNPLETRFLRRAREAGCRTVSGLEMLWAQGMAQFRLFTGRECPREALQSL